MSKNVSAVPVAGASKFWIMNDRAVCPNCGNKFDPHAEGLAEFLSEFEECNMVNIPCSCCGNTCFQLHTGSPPHAGRSSLDPRTQVFEDPKICYRPFTKGRSSIV